MAPFPVAVAQWAAPRIIYASKSALDCMCGECKQGHPDADVAANVLPPEFAQPYFIIWSARRAVQYVSCSQPSFSTTQCQRRTPQVEQVPQCDAMSKRLSCLPRMQIHRGDRLNYGTRSGGLPRV